jgi:PHD/YefM family antitoxin component YafN of YafNO toxin-antitoxin module
MIKMIITSRAIVSNSEMIKNYKLCREKAEDLGKIFILKNNQPDAVLLSIKEYQRLSLIIEYLDRMDENDILKIVESLPNERSK